MSTSPAGHIMYGDGGRVHICIREGWYQITPEDLGTLFFVGEPVLLMKKGPAPQVFQIAGTVYLSPSGQAIIIAIERRRYIVPRDRLLAVALGNEPSCDFYEVPDENTDVGIISPHKEGATP